MRKEEGLFLISLVVIVLFSGFGSANCNHNPQCTYPSSQACTINGYSGTKTCSSTCYWGACTTNQYCGDGIKNGNEQCDNGTLNTNTPCIPSFPNCTYCDTTCMPHTIFPTYKECDICGISNGKNKLFHKNLCVLMGDMNGDNNVNNLDTYSFSLALTNRTGYLQKYSGLDPIAIGDMNFDNALNNADIDYFASAITSGDYNTNVRNNCLAKIINCIDGTKNGNETDVDCGGGSCPGCSLGKVCLTNSDCLSGNCTSGVCRTFAIYMGSNNIKNMSKYQAKEVFMISDSDWHNVLPLVPVTTWTGSENCKKGTGTPSDVCMYPTLVYKDSDVIDRINIKSYDSRYGSLQAKAMIGSRSIYTGYNPSNYMSCDRYQDVVYGILMHIRGDYASVGDTIYVDFTFKNCNQTSSAVIFNISYEISPITSKYFSPAVYTLAPNQSMNGTAQVQFTTPLSTGADYDSAIYFLQQYSPSRLTLLSSNSELNNLLVSPQPFGAGLSSSNIQSIISADYFSYWQNFDSVVYVEDNYELALLASPYASLINAPLVIQGTATDSAGVFSGKKIICVGSVSPPGASCNESYNLEQLQQGYVQLTNTNKVTLVNPDDLDSNFFTWSYLPEKSSIGVYELEESYSLMAPFLAGARHEIIFPIKSSDINTINYDLKLKLSQFFGTINPTSSNIYLTILAGPKIIPFSGDYKWVAGWLISKANDPSVYADINGEGKPELYPGRIFGLSISDVSSYLGRELFYSDIGKSKNMKFMGSFVENFPCLTSWANSLKNTGYNAIAVINSTEGADFSPNEWVDQFLIDYDDHGAGYWAGIYNSQIPDLKGSLAVIYACSTCPNARGIDPSMCAQSIRKGAVGYMGTVDITWTGTNEYNIFRNGVYKRNEDIGKAFQKGFNNNEQYRMATLVGDPAFNQKPPYLLNSEIQGYC